MIREVWPILAGAAIAAGSMTLGVPAAIVALVSLTVVTMALSRIIYHVLRGC